MKHLLSGEDPEKVVSQIHDYLRDLGDRMRNNAIPAYKYTIYTQLGKNPQDYPNGGSMPSVQVALKLIAKGKVIKAKDVMSFVICGNSANSAEHAAKNAYPMDEVLAKGSELVPDVDYYLHKQILPPVERLCAPTSVYWRSVWVWTPPNTAFPALRNLASRLMRLQHWKARSPITSASKTANH